MGTLLSILAWGNAADFQEIYVKITCKHTQADKHRGTHRDCVNCLTASTLTHKRICTSKRPTGTKNTIISHCSPCLCCHWAPTDAPGCSASLLCSPAWPSRSPLLPQQDPLSSESSTAAWGKTVLHGHSQLQGWKTGQIRPKNAWIGVSQHPAETGLLYRLRTWKSDPRFAPFKLGEGVGITAPHHQTDIFLRPLVVSLACVHYHIAISSISHSHLLSNV